jgi:lipopolysaccharide/colanic/teichoic acid biosynthesis glycosyltransferase
VLSINLDTTSAEEAQRLLSEMVSNGDVSAIVVDFYDAKAQAILPELYKLLFSKVRFVDMHKVYEDVFGRVALSLLNHSWFLENISAYPKYTYNALKRIMDFFIALGLGLVSILIYPLVYIAIKLDDGGPVFITQERVGRDGAIIRIPKFRSMRSSDKGVWVKEGDDRITRVGRVLRKSRVDELPQLLSVLKGDMSLVGPRPDILALGAELSAQIPYYAMRNIIKPGLSGWAQTRQELPPQSLEETRVRLSYDFYYIKYRSLFLDLKIALQTLATLASRMGK